MSKIIYFKVILLNGNDFVIARYKVTLDLVISELVKQYTRDKYYEYVFFYQVEVVFFFNLHRRQKSESRIKKIK